MENYFQAEDFELWLIIENGPFVANKTIAQVTGTQTVPKERSELDSDYKKMEKNDKAKKLLYFGLGPDEYTRVSGCATAKEIWETLRVAHEGTNQVKKSRIELLVRKYELFEMGDKETIMEMFTRFTHITNEFKSLEKSFEIEDLVRKILKSPT